MPISSLYEGICSRDVATVLAAWLNATPKPLTAVLEDLAGTEVRIQVLASGERVLTEAEQFRLGTGLATCRWRNGLLIAGDSVAASTSLLWLPDRLPAGACRELDDGLLPAGRILHRFGMRRTDRRAMATTGIDVAPGPGAAVLATAVLEVGGIPAGIAEERITREFTESLPGRGAV
jgi:hypothetical protein